MTLAELTPDKALKALLDGIKLQTDDYEYVTINAYAQAETPNIGLDDVFIYISLNGSIESITHPIGVYKGNVAVSVNVRCYDNGTANDIQIREAIAEVERRCHYKTSGSFYFEPATYAMIMPTTVDSTTGYATTILNIKWHTIHK